MPSTNRIPFRYDPDWRTPKFSSFRLMFPTNGVDKAVDAITDEVDTYVEGEVLLRFLDDSVEVEIHFSGTGFDDITFETDR